MKDFEVVYIAGIGRNGGTLLDRILGQVPYYFSLGEFKFVWLKGVLRNELCNCGKPFRECPFWKEVFEKAFGGFDEDLAVRMVRSSSVVRGISFPFLLLFHRLNRWPQFLQFYRQTTFRLYQAVAEVSGARVLIDSSKFPSYAFVLFGGGFRLRLIHLVRDPRSVAFSWTKIVKKPEVLGREAYLRRYPPYHTALRWTYHNMLIELLRSFGKVQSTFVRWEDFIAKPRATLSDILYWCGLPQEDAIQIVNELFLDDRTVVLGPTHTSSGNPSRFISGPVEIYPPDHQRMERAGLSTHWRRVVEFISWPLLKKYGYSDKR